MDVTPEFVIAKEETV